MSHSTPSRSITLNIFSYQFNTTRNLKLNPKKKKFSISNKVFDMDTGKWKSVKLTCNKIQSK